MYVRAVQAEDLPFLWDMLWEAVAVSASMRAAGKEAALALPQNNKYLDGWGRTGDTGVVALDTDNQHLGAAWYRLFPPEANSYGFVAPHVPEITIGVAVPARGSGVGSVLLHTLVETARKQGYSTLSLSVDRQNPARILYENHGFHDAGVSRPDDTSITLIHAL